MASCYTDPDAALTFEDLLSYVLPYVLGAPTELLIGQVRLAAIEFCRRSGILHDVNEIDLQKGVQEYYLTTLCDYEIVRIYETTMLNQWVFRPSIQKPIRNIGVPFNSVGWWGNSWWCGPYGFYMLDPSTMQISPATQQDFPKGLRVEFITQPKQDSCSLHPYLYQMWAEGIAAGAIARLKMMRGSDITWYDPQGAPVFKVTFEKELGRARGTVDMNFTSGPVVMQAKRWV